MSSHSIAATARRLGLLYFLLAASTVINELYFSAGFTVAGDPAATAQNILADEFRYRLSILSSFIGQCLSIVLVAGLYNLLRDVDRRQAMLMLLFWMMAGALVLMTIFTKLLTLVLISRPEFMSSFSGQQLDALAFVFYKLRASGMTFVIGFWGLWLFPFGVLVIRSRMFPPFLGICLFLAGTGYVVSSLTSIAFPSLSEPLSSYLMPLYFGELPIIFWMLIKGAKAPEPLAT